VKTTFLLLTLILVGGTGTWYFQEDLPEPCIEDWAKQTKSLFTDASIYFKRFPLPKEQNIPNSEDLLDQKLKELLPTKNMDLKYRPAIEATTPITAALGKSQGGLLPDLFKKSQSDGTSLSGKVHMDEDDKIIGAEVEVAIPTSM
jgi:hypothetical protein